mgnify:CR=1 FL=1
MSRVSSQFLCVLVALLVCLSLLAKEIPAGKPERQGFSSERLNKITEHMNAKVEDGTMAGGMGLIARNGKVIYQQTYGFADREAGRVMENDAIYRIHSMTKPITAVALMILYEEGKYRLNDPIAWYLPEMGDLEVALSTAGTNMVSDGTTSRTIGTGDESLVGQTRKPTRQPTVRDLLRHTAGLTYGIFGATEVDKLYLGAGLLGNSMTLKDFTAALGKLPLQYDPGKQWHYSVSVDVQGRLVEVLSGMSFGTFLRERIFEPLDMLDTGFVIQESNKKRLARLYQPEGSQPGNFLSVAATSALEPAPKEYDAAYLGGSKFESGGSGLLSTARDYLRFSQMMLNGGQLDGVRILSPKTVKLMTVNHLGDISKGFAQRGAGFGLGFGLVLDPGRSGEISSAGEYNWGGLAGTRFWIDPEEELIGIFMVQSVPHWTRLGGDFKVLTYQSLVQ